MSTQTLVVTAPDASLGGSSTGSDRTILGISPAMANGDVTTTLPMLGYRTASATITGTFGAGGTVLIEGSFDGTNFFALPNGITGAALSIAAAGLYIVRTAGRFIRAHVTAGDGTTALIASIFLTTAGQP